MRILAVLTLTALLGACTHLDPTTGEKVGLFGKLSDPSCVNTAHAEGCVKRDGRLVRVGAPQ